MQNRLTNRRASPACFEPTDYGVWRGDQAQISEKRSADAPVETVFDALFADVVCKLRSDHGAAQSDHRADRSPQQGPFVCAYDAEFVALLLEGKADEAVEFIQHLRQAGISEQGILLRLLPSAARRLGEMWERDTHDFAEVTIGLCSLHRILRLRSWAEKDVPIPSANAPSIFLTTLVGDQHVFGVSIVAEIFRDAGWFVRACPGNEHSDIMNALKKTWFDVLGISASSAFDISATSKFIQQLRRVSRNPGIKVLVGGHAFSEVADRLKSIGADAFVADAGAAPVIAKRLHLSEIVHA